MLSNILPFERGGTFAGTSGMTVTDISIEHLVGKTYVVPDTEHETGAEVVLRLVKNDSGSAITTANQIVRFGTDAKDFARYVDGTTNVVGQIGLPIDDAYSASFSIPDDDYFYVVQKGPCDIAMDASSVALVAHMAVTPNASGAIWGTTADAYKFQLGTIDQDNSTVDTAALVWGDAQLWNPGGSGT